MVSRKKKPTCRFTLEQRVFMVEEYFKFRSYRVCTTRFQDRFPDCSPPHKPTIYRAVERFRRTGSVLDLKRSGAPTVLDLETLQEVKQLLIEQPDMSVRKLSSLINLSCSTAHKAITLVRKEMSDQHAESAL